MDLARLQGEKKLNQFWVRIIVIELQCFLDVYTPSACPSILILS